MSEKLKRRYSTGVRNALSVVPNVYQTMGATEERFLPSADQQKAPTNKILQYNTTLNNGLEIIKKK